MQYERDRDVDDRARADMEYLAREMASLRMALGEVATRDFLRSELKSLLVELDSRRTGLGTPRNLDSMSPTVEQVTTALGLCSIPRSRSRSPSWAWSTPWTSGTAAWSPSGSCSRSPAAR